MSLLPIEATWAEKIQDCFLAFRGSGLMLSALDVELMEDWAQRQIPLEVVVRGLRRAAEASVWDARPDAPTLRTLRACRRHVEAEFRKHQATALGRSTLEPPLPAQAGASLSRHRKLRKGLGELAQSTPHFQKVVARLLQGPLSEAPGSLEAALSREDRVYAALIRAFSFPERLALLHQARELSQNTPAVSWSARKMAGRSHRAAVLRRQLSLPSLW